MRSLEAFTLGKRRGQPETNEDSLVIVPGVGYAVVDGVTDRDGTLYDGVLGGRFASKSAAATINRYLLDLAAGIRRHEGPGELVGQLTEAVADGYRRNCRYEQVKLDANVRAGCAVLIALVNDDDLEVISVGDSGLRINGGSPWQDLKPLDDVTARLRREAWRYFEARGLPQDACGKLSMMVTWQGTRNQPDGSVTAEPGVRAEIEARALAVNRQALPDIPEWELLELIHHGIVHGQGGFQNAADRELGYGVIDGFDVPAKFIETISIPIAEIETLELFSDGYFSAPAGFGAAAWEDEFERVEREDPHKIGRFLSTKGTTDAAMTDDRTYLGVRLR
ncbi:PP2C family serine/threonine-protein phosphatase [Arvimicrobium flavum]|uniref:PP2C family serine/threonine-protein phosphatase n=1 Tax=Arvimicrobium flavum TaxID=3393320 RepID=UPI00237A9E1E|nr:PP2C family serine/threonine-protein phosphatase [Mesorhizobium shangrilense]